MLLLILPAAAAFKARAVAGRGVFTLDSSAGASLPADPVRAPLEPAAGDALPAGASSSSPTPDAELAPSDQYAQLAAALEAETDDPASGGAGGVADLELGLTAEDIELVPPALLEAWRRAVDLCSSDKPPPPLSLEDVSRMFDKSLPTVRGYANDPVDPLPYLERGSNGIAYKFELLPVLRWQIRRAVADKRNELAKQAAIGQMRLALFGGQALSESAGMSQADRANALKVEVEATRLAALRRDYISAAEVRLGLQQVLRVVKDQFRALPDQVAPTIGLDDRQRERLLEEIDNVLQDAADMIAAIVVESKDARAA